MDKSQFFDQLHKQLGQEFHCPPGYLEYIRSGYLHFHSDKEDLLKRTLTRLKNLIIEKKKNPNQKNLDNNISYFRGRLQFLRSLSDEDFIKITVKTEYDR